MKRMLIIDGHNLLFRMFWGIPSSIKNSRNEEIRGVIGFIGSVLKLYRQFEPEKLVVVFDSESSIDNRRQMDENYKSNRKIFDEKLSDEENPFLQLEKIYRVLQYMEIPYIEVKNCEADDYIASVAEKYKGHYEIIIVSTDRDFLQLVDERVVLYYPRGKMSVVYDVHMVKERYNILPDQVVQYKALVGDKSDNIKGVKGIGPKIAVKILAYGNIDTFIRSSDIEKLKYKILENDKLLNRNIALIALNRSIDEQLLINKVNEKYFNMRTYELLSKVDI